MWNVEDFSRCIAKDSYWLHQSGSIRIRILKQEKKDEQLLET